MGWRSHIQNLPRYDTVLALAKQHPDALLLDIGCGCAFFLHKFER